MSNRWWTAQGGLPELDDVERALLEPTGDAAVDLPQVFLAWHRVGSRMVGAVARSPLPDAHAMDTAILAVCTDAFDSMTSSVSKSLDGSYAPLLVRDVVAESVAGARSTFEYLVNGGVSPPVAMERTALVFGVPFRQLGSYLQVARQPAAAPRVVDHEADMAVMAAARMLAASEATSPVSKAGAFREEEVKRDDQGRFATEGGSKQPAVRRGGRIRLKRRAGRRSAQAPAAVAAEAKVVDPAVAADQEQMLTNIMDRLTARAAADKAKVEAVRQKRAQRAAARAAPAQSHADQVRAQQAANDMTFVRRHFDRSQDSVVDDGYSAQLDSQQSQLVVERVLMSLSGGKPDVTLRELEFVGGDLASRFTTGGGLAVDSEDLRLAAPQSRTHVRESANALLDDLHHKVSTRVGQFSTDAKSFVAPRSLAERNMLDDYAEGMIHIVEWPPTPQDLARPGHHNPGAPVRVTSMDMGEASEMSGYTPDPSTADDVLAVFPAGTLVGELAESRHGSDLRVDQDISYRVEYGSTSWVLDKTTGRSTMIVFLSPTESADKAYRFREEEVRRDEDGRFAVEGSGGSPRRSRHTRVRRRVGRSDRPAQGSPATRRAPAPASAADQIEQDAVMAWVADSFARRGISHEARVQAHRARQAERQRARELGLAGTATVAKDAAGVVDHDAETAVGINRDFLVMPRTGSLDVDSLVAPIGSSQVKFRLSPEGVALLSSDRVLDTKTYDPYSTLPGMARIVAAAHSDVSIDQLLTGMNDYEFAVQADYAAEYGGIDSIEDPSDAEIMALQAELDQAVPARDDRRRVIAEAEKAGKPFRVVTMNGRPVAVPVTRAVYAIQQPPQGVALEDARFEWQRFTQLELTGRASADLTAVAGGYQPEYWVAVYDGRATRGG
jgi:hypothetical protein